MYRGCPANGNLPGCPFKTSWNQIGKKSLTFIKALPWPPAGQNLSPLSASPRFSLVSCCIFLDEKKYMPVLIGLNTFNFRKQWKTLTSGSAVTQEIQPDVIVSLYATLIYADQCFKKPKVCAVFIPWCINSSALLCTASLTSGVGNKGRRGQKGVW